MKKRRSAIRPWTVSIAMSIAAATGAALVGGCVDDPAESLVLQDSAAAGEEEAEDASSVDPELDLEDEETDHTPPPTVTELEPRSDAESAASSAETSGTLQALMGVMDGFGEGSEERFEHEWRAFSTRADAFETLVDAFDRSSPEQAAARRKIAYAASLIPSEASVSFLERVALEEPAFTTDKEGSDRARSAAAAGLARMVASGEAPTAEVAIRQLLSKAEPAVARTAALELFVAGELDEDHRRLLSARNIPANFRKLTGEETVELLRVHREEPHDARRVTPSTISAPKHEG